MHKTYSLPSRSLQSHWGEPDKQTINLKRAQKVSREVMYHSNDQDTMKTKQHKAKHASENVLSTCSIDESQTQAAD